MTCMDKNYLSKIIYASSLSSLHIYAVLNEWLNISDVQRDSVKYLVSKDLFD